VPDEQTPNETPQTPQTPAETPAEQTPTTDTPASQEPAEETEGKPADQVKDLPDWAQKIITDLRGENANYRTRAKTAEEKFVLCEDARGNGSGGQRGPGRQRSPGARTSGVPCRG
jgi:hypothetical protein